MFKEIGSGYGDVGYGVTSPAGLDASTMDLDPILKPDGEKLAGGAKVRLMRACALTAIELTFVVFAMCMVLDDHHEPWWVLPTLEKVMTVTAPKWIDHIDALLRWGVLEESSWNELKCAGAYFGIPKTEELARAIWNGKFLCKHSRPSRPVNLPYLPEVLRRMAVLTRRHRKPLNIMIDDWLSYFNQLPVSKGLSHYFGVVIDRWSGSGPDDPEGKIKRHYYRWATAPMGMLHSPYECQGIGLFVLLWKEKDEEELVFLPGGKTLNQMKPLQSLPTYIDVKGGGFICLYYDNQLTCCVDPAICEKLRKRIQRNQELFGLVPKPGSFELHQGKDLVVPKEDIDGSTIKLPVYLGAAIYYRRTPNGEYIMCWRQSDKKLSQWKAETPPAWHYQDGDGAGYENVEIKKARGLWTPREIAAIIGKILWRRSLDLLPLCKVAPIIAILRRVSTERAALGGWDARAFAMTSPEASVLSTAWYKVLSNTEQHLGRDHAKQRRLYMATDSSDNYWGEMIFDEDGKVTFEAPHQWSTTDAARNIFMKELFCATTSVMRVLDEAVGPIEIHLACDNSAAAAAMRHMYSSNVLVCEELDRLYQKLQEKGSSLLVHSVRSEDNASDAASRNFSLDNMSAKQRTMVDEHGRAGPEIIKRCWDEIQAQIRGWRLGAPLDCPELNGIDGIRHGEMDADSISPMAIWDDLDPSTGESTIIASEPEWPCDRLNDASAN